MELSEAINHAAQIVAQPNSSWRLWLALLVSLAAGAVASALMKTEQQTDEEITTNTRPPDIGPGFEWRRNKQGWMCYRIYYVGSKRCLDIPVLLTKAKWIDLQTRLADEMLAVTLASWAIKRYIDREQNLLDKFPRRAELYED